MLAIATPRYSKTQVKKAGRLWARFLDAYVQRGKEAAFSEFSPEAILEADTIISSWRGLHAYPLRMVNANLRYYVREYDSSVTQRLKKHATITSKLVREPTMDLTRMEDIGGCRVTLPTQREVNDVVRRLKSRSGRSCRTSGRTPSQLFAHEEAGSEPPPELYARVTP